VQRKDGHHPIIFMQCGPIRYRTNDRQQAENRPFDHKVIIRPTRFQLPPHLQHGSSQPIQDIYEALTKDVIRNQLIVADVVAAMNARRFPVLLTERREHADTLVSLLSPHVKNIMLMTGGMGKKQRKHLKEKMAALPTDEPRLIVATGRYLGEGFDDTRLDTLFLALPISWRGTLTQYVGRLHRLDSAKQDVILYDYADLEVPVLSRMHAKRRSGYKALGYQIVLNETAGQAKQLTLVESGAGATPQGRWVS
jgi:superfamily II DNA or RNA helicase